jgi:sigma-B regulation protein RsbU (phosphoserine phosphatase)
LSDGGVALGMFEHSSYSAGQSTIAADELVAIYSDGITEAENDSGRPFDEAGLEAALRANRQLAVAAIGAAVVKAVERHTGDTKFADDLTVLLLRRTAAAAAGV